MSTFDGRKRLARCAVLAVEAFFVLDVTSVCGVVAIVYTPDCRCVKRKKPNEKTKVTIASTTESAAV